MSHAAGTGGHLSKDASAAAAAAAGASQAAGASPLHVQEETRESLLDVVISEYDQGKNKRTSRLFLVGVYRTAHHTEAEIEAWMKGLITKYQVQVPPNGRLRDTPGAITGFMASVNQAAIATVLEAPMSVLKKMIETLAEDEIDPKGMLRCKICLLVEEVPREFPVFVVRSHRMAVPDEFTPSGPDLLRPVYELYRAILNICRDSSLSGAHDDRRLQDLMDRFAATAFKTCSLSLEKIQAIMGSEDICTPVEWLSIFDAPLNFVLESEVVWPAEPWLQY